MSLWIDGTVIVTTKHEFIANSLTRGVHSLRIGEGYTLSANNVIGPLKWEINTQSVANNIYYSTLLQQMAYQQQPPPPGFRDLPPAPYEPPPAYYEAAPQYYPPPPQQQQQHQNTVVVMNTQPTVSNTTYVLEDESPNHLLHCCISIFCPWWIFVWICVCCIYGC